jgi:hypothetical protein
MTLIRGHPGEFMIDLESETPFVHWTSDAFNSKESHQTAERAVWHHSPILSYTIADSYVMFEAPPEWREGGSQVRFQRTSGGNYESLSQNSWFKSVRADSRTHVVMTGWWSAFRSGGTGIFIAALPVQQGQIPVEKMKQTIPVRSYA